MVPAEHAAYNTRANTRETETILCIQDAYPPGSLEGYASILTCWYITYLPFTKSWDDAPLNRETSHHGQRRQPPALAPIHIQRHRYGCTPRLSATQCLPFVTPTILSAFCSVHASATAIHAFPAAAAPNADADATPADTTAIGGLRRGKKRRRSGRTGPQSHLWHGHAGYVPGRTGTHNLSRRDSLPLSLSNGNTD
jgi:hypothetical protein